MNTDDTDDFAEVTMMLIYGLVRRVWLNNDFDKHQYWQAI
jgi:hypothetical protein